VGRGRSRWLVRVFLGRDRDTRKQRYHSRTVRGPVRHAQTYLNKVLRERDLGRRVEGVTISLNEFLDRWLETAAKPRLREKSYRSYESLLRRYVRPSLGERNLAGICPLDIQTVYQRLIERGLAARTIRYTHSVLRSAMRQAIRWRLLLEDPTNGSSWSLITRRLRARFVSAKRQLPRTFSSVRATLTVPRSQLMSCQFKARYSLGRIAVVSATARTGPKGVGSTA
jgi:hypothetical protein